MVLQSSENNRNYAVYGSSIQILLNPCLNYLIWINNIKLLSGPWWLKSVNLFPKLKISTAIFFSGKMFYRIDPRFHRENCMLAIKT